MACWEFPPRERHTAPGPLAIAALNSAPIPQSRPVGGDLVAVQKSQPSSIGDPGRQQASPATRVRSLPTSIRELQPLLLGPHGARRRSKHHRLGIRSSRAAQPVEVVHSLSPGRSCPPDIEQRRDPDRAVRAQTPCRLGKSQGFEQIGDHRRSVPPHLDPTKETASRRHPATPQGLGGLPRWRPCLPRSTTDDRHSRWAATCSLSVGGQ